MKWFRLSSSWRDEITVVEVVKETAAQVLVRECDPWGKRVRERRRNKVGEFFPTFAEAKQFALDRAQRRLDSLNDDRSRCIERIKNIQEMNEPKSE